jgi:hypothetical protein
MNSRFWGLIVLAAVSMLLLSVAACDDDDDDDDEGTNGDATSAATGGGDEELTLYFQDLAAIQAELNEGVGLIDEQSAFSDPAAARQSLEGLSTAGQAALSDLEELDVPADVTDEHSALEAAGTSYLSAVDSLADELQTIEAGEEFDAWLAAIEEPDSEYSQARAELQSACQDLETIATDNNVDVVLECPV